jgi:hypothetical protein
VDGASAHVLTVQMSTACRRAAVPRVISWKKEGSSIPFSTGKLINSSNDSNEDGFEVRLGRKVALATYVL